MKVNVFVLAIVTFITSPAFAEVLESQTRDMPFSQCKAFISGDAGGLPATHYKTITDTPTTLKKKLILADGNVTMTCTQSNNKLTVTRETK